jgi:hypothetical protein
VNPKYLPYYFLIAAGPDEIDFEFQLDLDVEHAVGRLTFSDPADYGHYADAVKHYEAAKESAQKPLLTCFSPEIDDRTTYSSQYLAGALAHELHGQVVEVSKEKTVTYAAKHDSAAEATKQKLLQHLSGAEPWPAVLFAASHGLGFKTPGHSRQVKEQGALECQDLAAHRDAGGKGIPASVLFGGLDVEEMLAVPNLVFFTFACYSAGTPLVDSFPKSFGQAEVQLATKPFVAHLAQQMLAKGALAYIGHVDRTWGYSFILEDVGFRIDTFSSALGSMLAGWTVGHAMEFFDRRYLSLNNELSNKVLPEYRKGETKHEGAPIDEKLASLWTERNDARNYVLLGDPAVRLNLAAMA